MKTFSHSNGFTRRAGLALTLLAVGFLAVAVIAAGWRMSLSQARKPTELKTTKLREAGFAVSLVEVARRYHDPSLNPEDNAAPLYQKAFAKMENRREAWDAISRIHEPLAALPPGAAMPPDIAEEAALLLRNNGEALALFREAAAHPHLRFDLDFTQGYDLLIPHAGPLRHGAFLLGVEAIKQTLRGETGAAAETLDILLASAAHLAPEPTLITQSD